MEPEEVVADSEATPVTVRIRGQVTGSSRPGLLALAPMLVACGLDTVVVVVGDPESIDGSGASALIEMLDQFSTMGSLATLQTSPVEVNPRSRDATSSPFRASC